VYIEPPTHSKIRVLQIACNPYCIAQFEIKTDFLVTPVPLNIVPGRNSSCWSKLKKFWDTDKLTVVNAHFIDEEII
jgi:hypothetical protein